MMLGDTGKCSFLFDFTFFAFIMAVFLIFFYDTVLKKNQRQQASYFNPVITWHPHATNVIPVGCNVPDLS